MDPAPLLTRLVHELLHGTVSPAVMSSYEQLCREDPFLSKTRALLSERMAGLMEEEIVTGLSEYIAVCFGLRKRDASLRLMGSACGYAMPVSVVLFDALCRCGQLPSNMEAWLLRFLETLRRDGVRAGADSVPPGYSRCFDRCSRREPNFQLRGQLL